MYGICYWIVLLLLCCLHHIHNIHYALTMHTLTAYSPTVPSPHILYIVVLHIMHIGFVFRKWICPKEQKENITRPSSWSDLTSRHQQKTDILPSQHVKEYHTLCIANVASSNYYQPGSFIFSEYLVCKYENRFGEFCWYTCAGVKTKAKFFKFTFKIFQTWFTTLRINMTYDVPCYQLFRYV